MQFENLSKFKWFHTRNGEIDVNFDSTQKTTLNSFGNVNANPAPPILLLATARGDVVLNHFRHGDFYVTEAFSNKLESKEMLKNDNNQTRTNQAKQNMPQRIPMQKELISLQNNNKQKSLNSAHSMPNLSNKIGKAVYFKLKWLIYKI